MPVILRMVNDHPYENAHFVNGHDILTDVLPREQQAAPLQIR